MSSAETAALLPRCGARTHERRAHKGIINNNLDDEIAMMTENILSPEAAAAFARMRAERAAYQERLPEIRAAGVAAAQRLLNVAQSDTGQSRRVARFLLGLYNGTRFPFDLTDLRGIDFALHRDCMSVLAMDFTPEVEIHRHFENGGALFERLAADWGWGFGQEEEEGGSSLAQSEEDHGSTPRHG